MRDLGANHNSIYARNAGTRLCGPLHVAHRLGNRRRPPDIPTRFYCFFGISEAELSYYILSTSRLHFDRDTHPLCIQTT